MAKIVIDANVPINFINPSMNFWDEFIDFAKIQTHEILMTDVVYDEVMDRHSRPVLRKTPEVKRVSVDPDVFKNIKNDCIVAYPDGMVQDPDYSLIALAVVENADYVISNDLKLINVGAAYLKYKGISPKKIIFANISGLFRLMHRERKDLFGWKPHVRTNLKFYHQIEIKNTCDGIKNRNWPESYAKDRFNIYRTAILNIVDQVGK